MSVVQGVNIHMKKHEPQMYDFYENYYKTTAKNPVFMRYCREVYGADFTQDGFSDINELNDLIDMTGIDKNTAVLDIGCGDGGMCEYIHKQTGAPVCGFDCSGSAIARADERALKYPALRFSVGTFGKHDYPEASFDVVLSVDTMYFAEDIRAFVKQIYGWLKPGGVHAAMYGCYDKIEPDIGRDSTTLARALRGENYTYEAIDYTKSYYRHMKLKRKTAEKMADDFRREGMESFYDRLVTESVDPVMTYCEFARHFSRYMYIVRK